MSGVFEKEMQALEDMTDIPENFIPQWGASHTPCAGLLDYCPMWKRIIVVLLGKRSEGRDSLGRVTLYRWFGDCYYQRHAQ